VRGQGAGADAGQCFTFVVSAKHAAAQAHGRQDQGPAYRTRNPGYVLRQVGLLFVQALGKVKRTLPPPSHLPSELLAFSEALTAGRRQGRGLLHEGASRSLPCEAQAPRRGSSLGAGWPACKRSTFPCAARQAPISCGTCAPARLADGLRRAQGRRAQLGLRWPAPCSPLPPCSLPAALRHSRCRPQRPGRRPAPQHCQPSHPSSPSRPASSACLGISVLHHVGSSRRCLMPPWSLLPCSPLVHPLAPAACLSRPLAHTKSASAPRLQPPCWVAPCLHNLGS